MQFNQVTDKFNDAVSDLKDLTRKWTATVNKKKNNKTALIVGIACAAVVIIAAGVTVAVMIRNKQKKQLAEDNLYDPEIIDGTFEEEED